jgi:hypothetical protein
LTGSRPVSKIWNTHAVRKWRAAESEQIIEPDERQRSILRQDPICTKRR